MILYEETKGYFVLSSSVKKHVYKSKKEPLIGLT